MEDLVAVRVVLRVVLKENEVDLDVLPCANDIGADAASKKPVKATVFIVGICGKSRWASRS